MRTRPFLASDRPALASLLAQTPEFTGDEADVALEIADEFAAKGPETTYVAWVAEDEASGELLGYVSFGPTPMTESTWDLYWIVIGAGARGRGLGRLLHDAAVAEMGARGGRRVRVETSTREGYGATLAYYDRLGYARVGLIADFYSPGDDLVTQLLPINPA